MEWCDYLYSEEGEILKCFGVKGVTFTESTIKNADDIAVISDGIITECGNHEKLLVNNGIYTKLYNQQFRDLESH